jgi:RNA-directed DNA polymerase
MTTAQAVGVVSSEAAEWYAIDWQAINRNVRRLQVRIVQATKANRWNKVKALQRLLTCSYSGKVLAVRRVTENNCPYQEVDFDEAIALSDDHR